MSSRRSTRGGTLFVFLAIAAALSLPASRAYAAGAPNDHTVLILDSTVIGGASSMEATQAAAQGFTVEVVSDADWGAKSQADFATYRALILGDPNCVSGTTTPIAAAEANRTTWTPVVNGNIIIIGTDEFFHSSINGAKNLSDNGIAFAANILGKTGLFASLSCYYKSVSLPENVPLLDQFGTLTTSGTGGCFNDAHIVAVNPVLAGLVDADLQNWNCSVHEIFTDFPAGFLPLAIARGITGPGSLTFADGSFGVPYILAKGVQAVGLNILKSGPATANVGDNITYTITYGNTGSADALNTVITDPVPAGTTFVSADNGGTNVAGVVTWNIGTLAKGTSGLTVQFTVHIDSGATITNTNYKIQATDVPPVVGPDVVTTPCVPPTAVANAAAAAICAGSGTTLTGSGGVSCSWSPASGLANANACTTAAAPSATTTYSLTVTDATGCTSTNNPSVTITVNPAPVLPPIAAPGTASAGKAGLTATAPNHLGSRYTWRITNGTITSGQGTNSITFTAGVAGNLFLDLVETSSAGCDSPNNEVTVTVSGVCVVRPTAVASAAATAICAGNGTTLTGSGGVSCSWSPANGLANANACTTAAAPSATTTYSLTVTDATGCTSTNNPSVTVTVNPVPVPQSPAVTPIGNPTGPVTGIDFLNLSWSAPSGGTTPASYEWAINGGTYSSAGGALSAQAPPTLNNNPITLHVKAVACNPAVRSAAADSPTYSPAAPQAGFSVSAQTGTVTVTDTSTPQATAWLWLWGDGTFDTRQSPPAHTYTGHGPYSLVLIATNGAGSSSTSQPVTQSATRAPLLTSAIRRFDATDPERQRLSRVQLASGASRRLTISATPKEKEVILYLRFRDGQGRLAEERRLSLAPGQSEAVYDLNAYGLEGAYSLELVSTSPFSSSVLEPRPQPRKRVER